MSAAPLLILTLLACSGASESSLSPSEPPAEPTPIPALPSAAPPEAPAQPAGIIGGEPILAQAIVLGAISTADVIAGITAQQPAIDACFSARGAADRGRSGKVLIKFSIGRDGQVKDSSTASTSLRDEATEACINQRVREATFRPLTDGDVAIVRYPFTFLAAPGPATNSRSPGT